MCMFSCFLFFNQEMADDVRISDWSSDVCSADLKLLLVLGRAFKGLAGLLVLRDLLVQLVQELTAGQVDSPGVGSHALGPSNERAVRIELQVIQVTLGSIPGLKDWEASGLTVRIVDVTQGVGHEGFF